MKIHNEGEIIEFLKLVSGRFKSVKKRDKFFKSDKLIHITVYLSVCYIV